MGWDGMERAEPKAERVVTTTSITINRLISWDGMGWEGASGAEGGASCYMAKPQQSPAGRPAQNLNNTGR